MDGGVTNAEGGESLEILRRSEGLWKIAGLSAWSFMFFISFLLNATLFFIFIKRPSLRTISNRFVMNLTVSNLLTVIIFSLLVIFDKPGELTSSISYGISTCSFAEGSAALVTASSILSVLIIAIDQYLAVLDPLHYRTRISNVKSNILIITMWTLSIILALLAALNPHPQGIWLLCTNENRKPLPSNATLRISINCTATPKSHSGFQELKRTFPLLNIQSNFHLIEDSTEDIDRTFPSVWYGLIYNLIFALFIYMIPFIVICWIYIKIYFAARENSERTRRTGSRPGLSSASFTEDYCLIRHDQHSDEVRKIPKISSLLSVDETLVKSFPSQTRRSSSPIAEESSSVIFTVGSHQQLHSNNTEITENKFDASDVLQSKYYKHNRGYSESYVDIEDNRTRLLCQNNEISSQSKQKVYINLTTSCPIISMDSNSDTPNQVCSSSAVDNKSSPVLFTVGSHQELYFNDIQHSTTTSIPTIQADFIEESRTDDRSVENQRSDAFNESIRNDASVDVIQILNYNANNASGDNKKKSFLGQLESDLQAQTIFHEPSKIQGTLPKDCLTGNYKCRDGRNYADFEVGYRDYLAKNIYPPIVTITPPSKTSLLRVASTRSTSSYINLMKHRISNGSLFKYREESRAARISAGVIVMGFICWTPYVVISGLRNCIFTFGTNFPRQVDILVIGLIVLATYISPLLFGYRSRRIKRELRKMFCSRKEISYKNNRSLMAKKISKRRSILNLSHSEMENKFNALNCLYDRNKWPKDKVHFVQVPESALVVETCRSSFSSGASTQISSTSTDTS